MRPSVVVVMEVGAGAPQDAVWGVGAKQRPCTGPPSCSVSAQQTASTRSAGELPAKTAMARQSSLTVAGL